MAKCFVITRQQQHQPLCQIRRFQAGMLPTHSSSWSIFIPSALMGFVTAVKKSQRSVDCLKPVLAGPLAGPGVGPQAAGGDVTQRAWLLKKKREREGNKWKV